MNGQIKRVKPLESYGFIRGDDGKEYFFHRSALKNSRIEDLREGQQVSFEDSVSDKGLRAEDVFA